MLEDRLERVLVRNVQVLRRLRRESNSRKRRALHAVFRDSARELGTASIDDSDWRNLADRFWEEFERREDEVSSEDFWEKVWPNLSEPEQRTLNAEAEDYRDEADYVERTKLTPEARRALREHLSPRDLFQDRIHTEIDSLFEAELQQMLADSTYARRRIPEVLDRASKLAHAAFRLEIVPNRPVDSETEDRHRYWSKLRYLKVPVSKIVEDERAQGNHSCNIDLVKKSVRTYRKRRAPVQKKIVERIWRDRPGTEVHT
jgi:hypothetical protein